MGKKSVCLYEHLTNFLKGFNLGQEKEEKRMDFPEYMCKGSSGPHVTLLQMFLVGNYDLTDPEFIFDEEYGDRTVGLVMELQESMDVVESGQFGPETHQALLDDYNVNFEAVCKLVPGETNFVQPDGTVIVWHSPKIV